tara:strand:- start:22 stop:333 length:312 start_codon:yes stop_codon:yes gene_type:complete
MKANQITAISAAVIAIGVVYTIVDSKIEDQQQQQEQERAIEFQQKQKFNAANRFCRENANGGMYRQAIRLDMTEDAIEFLERCMGQNGFWNVDCNSYGVCKQR